MEQKKYNYFYKITNLLNNHYYYGIHSTDNLDDGYMGSGKRLHYAYKKYGIENFTKEILKYFDTRKDASNYEAEMVTEQLVKDDNCYNCIKGGDSFDITGMCVVYDTYDNTNKTIPQEIFHSNKERYKGTTYGTIVVKEKSDGKILRVNYDEYINNLSMYDTLMANKITVRDKNNSYYCVDKSDPRYLSGELKPIWYGRKHKKEDIEKLKETLKEINHQQGEKNSQYGTCWIMKNNKSIKIKKEELEKYINNGWIKGRKCNTRNKKIDKINLSEILDLRKNGYNWKEIEEKLSICHDTMYKFKKNNNLL